MSGAHRHKVEMCNEGGIQLQAYEMCKKEAVIKTYLADVGVSSGWVLTNEVESCYGPRHGWGFPGCVRRERTLNTC